MKFCKFWPRFASSFERDDLSLAMKKLGVETIFAEDKANLTNISDDPLYVSKVILKPLGNCDFK